MYNIIYYISLLLQGTVRCGVERSTIKTFFFSKYRIFNGRLQITNIVMLYLYIHLNITI